MSVGSVEPNGDDGSNASQESGQGININPNWNPLLEQIPEVIRPQVLPHLQQWDQGVQQKINELHQQYDPYKELIENEIDVEEIDAAFALRAALNENPAQFLEQAIEWYKDNVPGFEFNLQSPQQQNTQNQDQFVDYNDDTDIPQDLSNDPRFKPFIDQQRQLILWQQEQEEERLAEEEEAELEEVLEELHEKHGNFNDDFVTALIFNEVDPDDAVQQFNEIVSQAAQALAGNQQQPNTLNLQMPNPQQPQQQQVPTVMGGAGNSGAGVPDGRIDFGKMSKSDTNDLVQQALAAAAAANKNQS